LNDDDKRSVIERYLYAYNTFDIDGIMSVIHPDIEFKNISGGEVNATASDNPILLLYDTQAGHSGGRAISKVIDDLALKMAFLCRQLGMVE